MSEHDAFDRDRDDAPFWADRAEEREQAEDAALEERAAAAAEKDRQ